MNNMSFIKGIGLGMIVGSAALQGGGVPLRQGQPPRTRGGR